MGLARMALFSGTDAVTTAVWHGVCAKPGGRTTFFSDPSIRPCYSKGATGGKVQKGGGKITV